MDLFLPPRPKRHKIRLFDEGFLDQKALLSLAYHSVFDYPLTSADLVKWSTGVGRAPSINGQWPMAKCKNGFYFLEGYEGAILKRLLRERVSKRKMAIARRAGRVLGVLPFVKMVGVTGSLSMMNAGEGSDIDLMIVTQAGGLWTTRILATALLKICGFRIRRAGDKNEKDKLCLNIWMDEGDLKMGTRNIYTAHEIVQVVPMVNKGGTYERFLEENDWVREWWPNAARVQSTERKAHSMNFVCTMFCGLCTGFEGFAFKLQYRFMKKKITRETVSRTRALFHPFDWGERVIELLG